MWFKNLRLYRFNNSVSFSAEKLESHLRDHEFAPCAKMMPSSIGWVSPLGSQGEQLTHVVNANVMICLRKETKIVPAAVVRELVNEKVEALESTQLRKIGRKERLSIRDDLMVELMPRALCRTALTYAYINLKDGLLVIDAASLLKAEELISLLRVSMGSLPVAPLTVRQSPVSVMTDWMSQARPLPENVSLGDEAVLRETTEPAGIVRSRHVDLMADEMRAHIEAGKQVTRLALSWQGVFSFVLEEDISIKRLCFSDMTKESSSDVAEDEAQRFDNDFAIMSLELAKFIPQLLEFLGGEDLDAAQVDGQAA